MSKAWEVTIVGDKRIVPHDFRKGETFNDDNYTYNFNEDCVVDRVEVYKHNGYNGLRWEFDSYNWATLRPKNRPVPDPVPRVGFWARLFGRRGTIPQAKVVTRE